MSNKDSMKDAWRLYKKCGLCLLAWWILVTFSALAQSEEWLRARSYWSTSSDGAEAIAVDSVWNSVTIGEYELTMSVDGNDLTANGSDDVVVIKHDSNGDVLWSTTFGWTSDERPQGVAIDNSGNIFAVGDYQGTMTVSGTVLTSTGSDDAFVVKLDSDGNILWAIWFGWSATDRLYGAQTDSAWNVYAVWRSEGTYDIGSDTVTGLWNDDAVVVKIDTNGSIQRARWFSTANLDGGEAIAVDSSANVYIGWRFQWSLTASGDTLISNWSDDGFLIKLNSGWTILRSTWFGWTNADVIEWVSVDSSWNPIIAWRFEWTVTIGSDTLISNGANNDPFVVKYDSDGNVLRADSFGSTNDDEGEAVTVDWSNNIYVVWRVEWAASFGSDTLNTNGSEDVFVVKYDSDGTQLWGDSFGSTSIDRWYGVGTDGDGDIYIVGQFRGTMTIWSDTLTLVGSTDDIFVAKFWIPVPASCTTSNALWIWYDLGFMPSEFFCFKLDGSMLYTNSSLWSSVIGASLAIGDTVFILPAYFSQNRESTENAGSGYYLKVFDADAVRDSLEVE